MIPVHFDQCAGMLHEAARTPRRRGVVIAPAFGFEDLCSRRAMRILADRLAENGIATLRFDFHGTGDSAGDINEPDLLTRWQGNLGAAIERLRTQAGVDEVTLVGMRLGAWLALLAAGGRDDVGEVVALAPPASGKAYLRELAALARIVGTAPEGGTATAHGVAGFDLPEALAAAIGALTPASLTRAPARRARLVGREANPPAPALANWLEGLGCEVTTDGLAGYDRMMCDPTASQAPVEALTALANGIAAGAAARSSWPRIVARTGARTIRGPGYREDMVRFGPNGQLAGVLCEPERPLFRAPPAVLITNAGGIHHVGWGRMGVDQARALAAAGIASLRMDFSGIGDSRADFDNADVDYYEPATREEVMLGVGVLKARGYDRLIVAGACAGAYQAFHAALEDARVDGLVLVNQLCFIWDRQHAMPLAAWKRAKAFDMAVKARAADESLADLARLRARVTAKAMTVAKTGARSLLALARDIGQRLATPSEAETRGDAVVAGWFEQLSRRGVRVAMVQGETDGSREELRHYMGPDGERAVALPGVSLTILPQADHTLTQRPAREALTRLIIDIASAGQAPERRATPRAVGDALDWRN